MVMMVLVVVFLVAVSVRMLMVMVVLMGVLVWMFSLAHDAPSLRCGGWVTVSIV